MVNNNTDIKVPVLVIAFNRPKILKDTFEYVRNARPKKLYVAVDGPRADVEGEAELVEEVKQIVSNVDWDCDVNYRFLEKNLGCGEGPASAISWAFEKENRLIILEDDCVPAQPFFSYCDYLLEKYAEDERIWLISGRSHHAEYPRFSKYDCIFTYFGHTWGWATWRRCWDHFDIDMKDFPLFVKEGGFYNVFHDRRIAKYYNKKFQAMYDNKSLQTHVWDYQWMYARLKNKGLCVVPGKNMIHNLGAIGTHSSHETEAHRLAKHEDYILKREPYFIMPDRNYEVMHFKKHINKKTFLFKRIINKGLKILNLK